MQYDIMGTLKSVLQYPLLTLNAFAVSVRADRGKSP